MRRYLIAGAAAAALVGLASNAGAATVVINSSHVIGGDTVSLTGTVGPSNTPLPYPNVMEGPEAMNISVDGGQPFDIVAFCVDLFHLWPGAPPSQTYETAPVTNDSNSPASGGGDALSDLISGEIGFLAQLAQSIDINTADGQHRLAGIQGAIWSIEYPNVTVNGGSSYLSTYQTDGANWAATHINFQGHANGIYSVGGDQGFGVLQGFTTGGVPEPAAWTLMIGGFGLAGALLRRRRSALA
jgi:hypothetical protein